MSIRRAVTVSTLAIAVLGGVWGPSVAASQRAVTALSVPHTICTLSPAEQASLGWPWTATEISQDPDKTQWVSDRNAWVVENCDGVFSYLDIGESIDCRMTLSTLSTDSENQLVGLVSWVDAIYRFAVGSEDYEPDWWATKLVAGVPFLTHERNEVFYKMFRCDLHPIVPALFAGRNVASSISYYHLDSNPTVPFGSFCDAVYPLGGDLPDQFDGEYNWLPTISSTTYQFGCPEYSPDADYFVDREFTLESSTLTIWSGNTHPASGDTLAVLRSVPGAESPVGSEPGACCTSPNFGPDDPGQPWSERATKCGGLTITSDDNSETYFVEGDPVTFSLSQSSPGASLSSGIWPVQVAMVWGIPGESQRKSLGALGSFEMTVPPDGARPDLEPTEPRILDYVTFHLQCGDGTTGTVYYDPSGSGGPRRVNTGGRPDLDACLSAAPGIGLDPDSWVPGLVERLKCLAEWAVTPEKPMTYWVSLWQSEHSDSATGQLLAIATAPYVAMQAASSAASSNQTIGAGTDYEVTLPEPPEDARDTIRVGLEVLVLLFLVGTSVRMIASALSVPSPHGEDK